LLWTSAQFPPREMRSSLKYSFACRRLLHVEFTETCIGSARVIGNRAHPPASLHPRATADGPRWQVPGHLVLFVSSERFARLDRRAARSGLSPIRFSFLRSPFTAFVRRINRLPGKRMVSRLIANARRSRMDRNAIIPLRSDV